MVAPSRTGTGTTSPSSSNRNNLSISHTSTADTDMLIAAFIIEGQEEVTTTPQFDGNDMTLIHDTGPEAASDVRVLIYGIVSPGAVTANVTITFASNVNPSVVFITNWKDVESTSVGNGTNFISDDVNTAGTTTSVLASGGVSGNSLYSAGAFQGADGDAATIDNGSIIETGTTGPSNSLDFAFIQAEILTGLPQSQTITWQADDENTAAMIELVAVGAGPVGGAVHGLATLGVGL